MSGLRTTGARQRVAFAPSSTCAGTISANGWLCEITSAKHLRATPPQTTFPGHPTHPLHSPPPSLLDLHHITQEIIITSSKAL